MVISSVSIVSTLILCYFLSESEATYIHNFPRDYVTNTGREYPEVIIFRYGMISTSFILVTLFYLVFSWMKKKAEEIGYEGGTFYPLRFVAIFGILC